MTSLNIRIQIGITSQTASQQPIGARELIGRPTRLFKQKFKVGMFGLCLRFWSGLASG